MSLGLLENQITFEAAPINKAPKWGPEKAAAHLKEGQECGEWHLGAKSRLIPFLPTPNFGSSGKAVFPEQVLERMSRGSMSKVTTGRKA